MAGKILSKKNLNSLKKILSNTAKLLKDAGVDEESLADLLVDKSSIPLRDAPANPLGLAATRADAANRSAFLDKVRRSETATPISAGFTEDLQDTLWRENFRSAIGLAEEHFIYAALYGDRGSDSTVTRTDLEQIVTEIIPVISQYLEGMPKYENLPEYALYCEALAKEEVPAVEIAAGAKEVFKTAFAHKAWRTSCESAFSLFKRAVFDLMHSFVGSASECIAQAKEILAELDEILRRMIDTAPCLSDTVAASSSSDTARQRVARQSVAGVPPVIGTVEVASQRDLVLKDDAKLVPSATALHIGFQQRATDEGAGVPPHKETDEGESVDGATSLDETIAASRKVLPASTKSDQVVQETITVSCSSVSLDVVEQGYNKHPFSGILLRVDEASDSPPGLGPKNKLFVPMDVAKTAAAIINASGGLPLDVKDDLSGHNDINIFGVMTSAEVIDKDFHVSGHLFPVNKPEEVKAIAANKANLGMSINASARHHPEAIFNPLTNQEETVAYVDSLIPSGANILLSQLATWTQTKILQAQASNDEFPSNKNENEMNTGKESDSNSNVDQIKGLLDGFFQKQEVGMNNLQQTVDEMKAQAQKRDETIAVLKAEKDKQDSLISAQKAEEDQKKSDERLMTMVAAVVKQTINPSNSPRSLTANYFEPLSAAAVDTSNEASDSVPTDFQRELIAAQAQFDVLTENNVTGPARIKASDKLKRLQRQASAR